MSKINKNNFHFFTKEELRKVLAKGDDTKNNLLYIDLDGFVRLKNNDCVKFLRNNDYIVRDEIYGAYHGYVGKMFYDSTFDKLYEDLKKAVNFCYKYDSIRHCLDEYFE